MDGLIAIPHEQGLSLLQNELYEKIASFELIDTDNNVYHADTIHSSYFDNGGILTIIVIIPKENHFTVWNKSVRIKSDDDRIIADVQTPAIQFVTGVGGEQEIKLTVSGEAGEIVFKADEYITDSELNNLYINPINIKLNKKALLGGSSEQKFKVANGEANDEAINKAQIDSLLNDINISNFANNMSLNGYQKLPNGLLIQWTNTTVNGTQDDVLLPLVFPNSGLFAGAFDGGSASSIMAVDSIAFPTPGTVRVNLDNATTSICRVFAIGY